MEHRYSTMDSIRDNTEIFPLAPSMRARGAASGGQKELLHARISRFL